MKRALKFGFGSLVLSVLFCVPALALGPVDGEVGAVWWANDFDTEAGTDSLSTDAGAPGFRAELWAKSFGVRATLYSSEPEDLGIDSSDYTSIDLMWKAFAPTDDNFFALGLGWEETDITIAGGVDFGKAGLGGLDTSGARISAEGRFGLAGAVYGYGQLAYLPSMDDVPIADGIQFEDVEGMEYELGVSWKMLPFVSLRAGYRVNSMDFTQTSDLLSDIDGSIESKGFLLGAGVTF